VSVFCINLHKISKALIIGPVYDQIDKFEKIENISKNYDITIINGSICYLLDNLQDKLNKFQKILNNKIIYLASDLDYVSMRQNSLVENWVKDKPNVASIKFKSGSSVIVTSGGVPNNLGLEGLQSNLKISFMSMVGETPWHHQYNGMLGYVISNNPLSDKPPEFFNYSCRIGINYNKNKIYCQEIDEYKLKNTILL
jgi:hypothetical protein